jgi:hypothetical protein
MKEDLEKQAAIQEKKKKLRSKGGEFNW